MWKLQIFVASRTKIRPSTQLTSRIARSRRPVSVRLLVGSHRAKLSFGLMPMLMFTAGGTAFALVDQEREERDFFVADGRDFGIGHNVHFVPASVVGCARNFTSRTDSVADYRLFTTSR